ncbi:MAG: OmpA family protein [Novosphingobium sp.]
MTVKVLVAAGALLASTSALAQAGPVETQSARDLVCQLSGDCAFDQVEATEEKPDARGFKIARTSDRTNAGPTVQPRRPAPGYSRVAVAPTGRAPVATAPGRTRPALAGAKASQPGRATLSVTFVSGSATLTEYGKREALTFASALKAPSLAGKRFRIEGHTDAVGSRDSNLELSKRRAASVVDFLAANGADRAQFDIQGYGPDKPVSDNPAKNRRVEVVLVK